MTALLSSSVPAHQEDYHNGQIISWPAFNVTSAFGCHVLAYRGIFGFDDGQQYLTIVSSDGLQTLRFGAFWNGQYGGSSGFTIGSPSSGVYTSSGNSRFYNGPYTAVLPTEVNLEDEAFVDVEIVDTLDYAYDDFTGKVPGHPRSSPIAVHGGHIVDGAVGSRHLAKAHISQGTLAGGALQCVGGTGTAIRLAAVVSQGDALFFRTSDGSGDQGTPGMYRIVGAMPFVSPPTTASFLGADGNPNQSVNFPPTSANTSSPGGSEIFFCLEFPGASSAPVIQSAQPNAHLQAGVSYFLRFCPYQTVTAGGYTQIIESPLSQFVQANMPSDGLNTHSFQVTLPPLPTDSVVPAWTGYRVYMTYGDPGNNGYDNSYSLLTQGTDYNQTGGLAPTLTVLTHPALRGAITVQPSMGFSPWPPGTRGSAPQNWARYMMLVGSLNLLTDPLNTQYIFTGGSDNTAMLSAPQVGSNKLFAHANLITVGSSTGTTSNPVPLLSNGSNLLYGTSTTAGQANITNGGVQIGLDSLGHEVETGGHIPQQGNINGTYFSGANYGAISTDRRGFVNLICIGVNPTSSPIPARTPLFTIVFFNTYASQPYVKLTPVNFTGGAAGLYVGGQSGTGLRNPGPATTTTFTIYNALSVVTQSGDQLSFYYEVSG